MKNRFRIKKNREHALQRAHHWVFSGAVAGTEGACKEGEEAFAVSENGSEILATGICSAKGSIVFKALAFEEKCFDQAFWNERIAGAVALRRSLGLINNPTTTGFRLLHAEGDALPGLVIDLFGSAAVIEIQLPGIERYLPLIVSGIDNNLRPSVETIFVNDQNSGEKYYLRGDSAGDTWFKEHDLYFKADWEEGQKTGFFLDQRDNRKLVSNYSAGKDILNAFCYTGGFSIAALKGGARSVTSLDSSKRAMEVLEENLIKNFGATDKHLSVCDKYTRFMGSTDLSFDVAVVDPPAFAKSRNDLNNAAKGYRSANLAAIQKLRPNGLLATFSCSQLLPKDDFRQLIIQAAREAGRTLQIVHQLSQATCHPVNAFHPESEYLKGLICFVA